MVIGSIGSSCLRALCSGEPCGVMLRLLLRIAPASCPVKILRLQGTCDSKGIALSSKVVSGLAGLLPGILGCGPLHTGTHLNETAAPTRTADGIPHGIGVVSANQDCKMIGKMPRTLGAAHLHAPNSLFFTQGSNGNS